MKTTATTPMAAMAKTMVGGIRNRVLEGGAVRAMKNAMAHSGIASLRWNTRAISSLLELSTRGRPEPPIVSATRDVQRAIARSSSPRLAELTPPGTRILGLMTNANNAMTMPTMNNISVSPHSPQRTTILTRGNVTVCALPHAASETRFTVSGASAYLKVESERAALAIVHVASHSRQRHKVVTVMVLAIVSTRLSWHNGHVVGRVTASLNRDSYIVAMFPSGVAATHR